MRKFYYIRIKTSKKVITKVYCIKNNDIVFVGEFDYVEHGDTHDVFRYLVKIGKIPEKYLQSSVNFGMPEGLFFGEVTKIYALKNIT